MATGHSTPSMPPAMPGRLPFFELCEDSGKYKARRKLTSEQIIRAAKAALANRVAKGAPFTSPEMAADYFAVHYSDRPAEVFICLFLDNRHRLIAAEELFHGTIDGASVYPRQIALRCLELNAAAVIFGHNHPSGQPAPSLSDMAITRKIQDTLALIEVRVLDHFIVGGGNSFSFAANGAL